MESNPNDHESLSDRHTSYEGKGRGCSRLKVLADQALNTRKYCIEVMHSWVKAIDSGASHPVSWHDYLQGEFGSEYCVLRPFSKVDSDAKG